MPRTVRELDPFAVITALGVIANLAIVWSFAHVAAQDHANHIASLHVLRRLYEGDPFFVERFRVAPRLVPDLLSEMIWFAALRGARAVVAGKALLSLYVIGLPLAWWSFVRRYCDGARALVPLGALFTMNIFYALGSTNYLLGLPLFLAASVAWDRVRDGWRWLALFALGAFATWLAHLYDYVFLLAFVGAHALAHLTKRRLPTLREWVGAVGLLAGFAAAAAAVLTREGEWSQSAPPRFDLSPRVLLEAIEQTLFLRGSGGTRYAALALALPPLAALAAASRRRSLDGVIRRVPAFAALAMTAAMWIAPRALGDEASIKPRFAVAAALLAWAAVATPVTRGHRALAAVTLAALVAYKALDERAVAVRFNARAAAEEALIESLPRHASVLPVAQWSRDDLDERLLLHLTDLAVIEREAYVTDLFDAPGQQILRYRRDRARPSGVDEMLSRRMFEGHDFVWLRSDDPSVLGRDATDELRRVRGTSGSALYAVRGGATRALRSEATGATLAR